MKEPIRIAIYVEGGLVQGVFTDCSAISYPIEVVIYDYDTEGADGDEIMVQADGQEFVGSIIYADHVPSIVNYVFNAVPLRDTDNGDK